MCCLILWVMFLNVVTCLKVYLYFTQTLFDIWHKLNISVNRNKSKHRKYQAERSRHLSGSERQQKNNRIKQKGLNLLIITDIAFNKLR